MFLDLREFLGERRTVVSSRAGPQPVLVPKANFCANCGSRLGEGNSFCGMCGAPITPMV
jgi:predicted amidophosphoribosyltransferase